MLNAAAYPMCVSPNVGWQFNLFVNTCLMDSSIFMLFGDTNSSWIYLCWLLSCRTFIQATEMRTDCNQGDWHPEWWCRPCCNRCSLYPLLWKPCDTTVKSSYIYVVHRAHFIRIWRRCSVFQNTMHLSCSLENEYSLFMPG